MRRFLSSLCCVAGLLVWSASVNEAFAQRSGGSGGGGGSSLFSQQSSGGGQGGSGASMSGGGGGSRAGAGGAATSLGGGMGGGGRGGAAGAGGLGGDLSTISMQDTGFIGRNGDIANFIGAVEQGRGNAGGRGGGQRSFGGGGGRGLDAGILNQLNGQNTGTTGTQATIRPRLQANFTHPAPNLDVVVTQARVRFESLAVRHPHLAGIQMTQLDGGKVVLTGEVASAEAAKLAASMLRLEPGVRSVQNDLTYPTAPTGP